MIGKTNVAGGGGVCALVHAYYTPGTICSCTNGSIMLVSDASGEYVFKLPMAGNWTVSGTDYLDQSVSATFAIAIGDSQTVFIDTLIPSEYGTTYQAAERIRSRTIYFNISTGLSFVANTGTWDIKTKMIFTDSNTSSTNLWNVVGHYNSSQVGFGVYFKDSNFYFMDYTATSLGSQQIDVPQVIEMHKTYTADDDGYYSWCKINDEYKSRRTTTKNLVAGEIKIGWQNTTNTLYAARGYYYGVKIWSEGILSRDMIPCQRRSDGMPGMFDKVTNTFYQAKYSNSTTIEDVSGAGIWVENLVGI